MEKDNQGRHILPVEISIPLHFKKGEAIKYVRKSVLSVINRQMRVSKYPSTFTFQLGECELWNNLQMKITRSSLAKELPQPTLF